MFFRRRVQSAFTLIELLVVIAIIAILIACFGARGAKGPRASARTQCTNNLKQIGIAMHAYLGVNKGFPPGAKCDAKFMPDPSYGWPVFILPYLEQASLFQKINPDGRSLQAVFNDTSANGLALLQTPLSVFLCPSDDDSNTLNNNRKFTTGTITLSKLNYVGNNGNAGNTGILNTNSVARVNFAHITDGTSNTLAAGERKSNDGSWAGLWAGYSKAQAGAVEWHALSAVTLYMMQTGVSVTSTPFPEQAFSSKHAGGATSSCATAPCASSVKTSTGRSLATSPSASTTGWDRKTTACRSTLINSTSAPCSRIRENSVETTPELPRKTVAVARRGLRVQRFLLVGSHRIKEPEAKNMARLPLVTSASAFLLLVVLAGCGGRNDGPSDYERSVKKKEDAAEAIRGLGGKTTMKAYPLGKAWVVVLKGVALSDGVLDDLKKMGHIAELDLSKATLSDELVARLNEVEIGSVLFKLDLSYTGVTDAGLDKLDNLLFLGDLNLTGTKVTSAGIQQFLKKHRVIPRSRSSRPPFVADRDATFGRNSGSTSAALASAPTDDRR